MSRPAWLRAAPKISTVYAWRAHSLGGAFSLTVLCPNARLRKVAQTHKSTHTRAFSRCAHAARETGTSLARRRLPLSSVNTAGAPRSCSTSTRGRLRKLIIFGGMRCGGLGGLLAGRGLGGGLGRLAATHVGRHVDATLLHNLGATGALALLVASCVRVGAASRHEILCDGSPEPADDDPEDPEDPLPSSSSRPPTAAGSTLSASSRSSSEPSASSPSFSSSPSASDTSPSRAASKSLPVTHVS